MSGKTWLYIIIGIVVLAIIYFVFFSNPAPPTVNSSQTGLLGIGANILNGNPTQLSIPGLGSTSISSPF